MYQIEKSNHPEIDYLLTNGEHVIDGLTTQEVRNKFCHRIISRIALTGEAYNLKTECKCNPVCRKVESIIGEKF